MSSALLALGDNTTLTEFAQAAAPRPVFLFNPLHIEALDWQKNISLEWNKMDKVIAISTSAVEYGIKCVIEKFSSQIAYFAVGKSTAEAIQKVCSHPVCYPHTFSSEGLLDLPALQHIAQQKILIFKGLGGRELLARTLQQRQAIVYTIDCYQRKALTLDLTETLKIWQNSKVRTLIVTSDESLTAFMGIVPEAWLHSLTLIVTSERLAKVCQQKGFTHVKRARHFTCEALLNVMQEIL